MDRLTKSTNFAIWKMRVVPLVQAKAKKMGVEPIDLLPTVLDDVMCSVYARWLSSHDDPKLDDALAHLDEWLQVEAEFTVNSFFDRKWNPGESVEEFVTELLNPSSKWN
jgi:hypothetical protein